MLEEKILLFVQFVLEVLRISIAVQFLFGGKIKRIWFAAGGGIFFIVFLYIGKMPYVESALVMWGIILLLYFLTTDKPLLQHWTWRMRKGFLLYYQEELISLLVEDVTYFQWKQITDAEIEFLSSILSFMVMTILCVIYRVCNTRIHKMFEVKCLEKVMSFLLVFVLVEMVFQITGFNYIAENSGNEKQLGVAMVISIFSMISLGFFSLIVFFIRNMNEKMQQALYMERQMQQQQVQYYEALLHEEEETRRYQHDMNAHMMSLSSLVAEGDIERTKGYIDGMMECLQSIRKSTYKTGNQILDSILNFYLGQLNDKVVVSVKGMCQHTIAISDIDMCTVFSNLFQNAVEALQAFGQSECFLKVQIDEGTVYMKMVIENSIDLEQIQTDTAGNFQTSKKDKKNHGLGLLNVKEVVKRNGGKFDVHIEGNQFSCYVILRMQRD